MHASLENLLERKSIRALPDEILLSIFSYLQTHDIKYSVSNVCVQWSLLARDKKLWKHLVFKTTNRATKTFGIGSWYSTLRFLASTPQLQNVIISHGHSDDEINEMFKVLNESCPNLRNIDFDTNFTSILKHVKDLSNTFAGIESLSLTLDSSSSHGSTFRILANFKNLKKVTLRGPNPEPSSFKIFLRDHKCLEQINVAGVEFSKINFMSLWNAKDNFESLTLNINKLDENCLKLLGLFPKLKSLNLKDENSSPGKLAKIGKLKCLSRLYLQEAASSPVLTASALANFFQNGFFLNLKELKLHKSRLNDEGAAEIRRNCINLMYLEVMTYPRSLSSLSEQALLHFLHCTRLEHFEILFDNSEEADWIYKRIRHVRHDCDIDEVCPIGLDELLDSWDEIHIPVD